MSNQPTLSLQIACLLQEKLREVRASLSPAPGSMQILENAAQEFGDDNWKPQHACCDHQETLNPNLWGAFPPELLLLVFARLPVEDMHRLPILSKHRKETISEVYEVCKEVNPGKILCLITRAGAHLFYVRALDMNRRKWYTYQLVSPHSKNVSQTLDVEVCEDAGLVCFFTHLNWEPVEKKSRPGLCLYVVNPLTKVAHDVPPLLDVRSIKTWQIKVNKSSKSFKLFVLADQVKYTSAWGWRDFGILPQVYDSLTEEWTTLPVDLNSSRIRTYGFGNGGSANSQSMKTDRFAFYKDRFYMLGICEYYSLADKLNGFEEPTFCIEEFRREMGKKDFVKVKAHRCDPFEHPPKARNWSLHACGGFLLVTFELSANSGFEKTHE